MGRKPSYEVLDRAERDVVKSVPTKIRVRVKDYRNGGYVWLPKEWAGRTVIIELDDTAPTPSMKPSQPVIVKTETVEEDEADYEAEADA